MDVPADWIYYTCGVLLLAACVAAWVSTLFTLPGNWIIVGLAALFAFFLPDKTNGLGVSWIAVLVLAALAGVGEVLEALASAAGAAKQGASRRAMALSLLGAMVGSMGGAIVGVPVPLVGPLIGAIGGGAGGAFIGAFLGELWKGRLKGESANVGKAAAIGRLLGTSGKLIVGAMMVAFASVAALWA